MTSSRTLGPVLSNLNQPLGFQLLKEIVVLLDHNANIRREQKWTSKTLQQ